MITSTAAGLGAVVARQSFGVVEATQSIQHAELQAALLALRHVGRGANVCLHLDCQNAQRQLSLSTYPDDFRPLLIQINEVISDRELRLEVIPMPRDRNPAHHVARQARFAPGEQGTDFRILDLTLKAGSKVMVSGSGFLRSWPAGTPGMTVLQDLTAQLPRHSVANLHGTGAYTRFLWEHPEKLRKKEKQFVQQVRGLLKSRQVELTIL